MKKLKVILFKGLPASGKTTAAKKLQSKYPNKYKRINRDDLRAMIDNGEYSPENERALLDIRDALIFYYLGLNRNVIIDDTNLNSIHKKRIKEICVAQNAKLIIKEMKVSLNTCIKRDSKRERSVGAMIIRKMHKDYFK